MHHRHSTDHIRTTRAAEWDKTQERSGPRSDERSYHDSRQHDHQFDGRHQHDPRFESLDRQARPAYATQPRSFDRRQEYAHSRPLPTGPYEDSRRSYVEDPHRHPSARRSQEFLPTSRSNSRPSHGSYPHPSSRSGPSSVVPSGSPSYHSHGPAPHEDRSHGSWPPRIYEANSQFNHGPPKEKSKPSQSVIFMGLPIQTDEATLRLFLEQCGAEVDTVTIIYDRNTGLSKRYGFARFVSVEHARAFVEPHYPLVTWKEPSGSRFDNSGDGLTVKIDYSAKEKIPYEARHREKDSFRRSPPVIELSDEPSVNSHSYQARDESAAPAINDGARDIGGTPTSILLLRGFDPMSTEQEIAKHLQNIPDPSQTVLPDSIRKVMLIKDRLSRSSWGYAFVQFSDVQIAVKALSLLLNTSLFPRGFQIRSRVLTVTFAHEHSFHPVYTSSDWSFRGPGGQELAYWDDKAYAAVYVPAIHIADDPHRPNNGIKKNQDWNDQNPTPMEEDSEPKEIRITNENDQNGKFEPSRTSDSSHDLQSASDSPPQEIKPADASHTSNLLARKPSPTERVDHEPRETKPSSNMISASSNKESQLLNPDETQVKETKNEKKKSTELIASKKMAANIEKWNSKKNQETVPPSTTQESSNVIAAPENLMDNNDEDFSDLIRLTCILCQRQFKTAEDLGRHNELSNLHKTNLENDSLKRAARLRKQGSVKSAKRSASSSEMAEVTPKYTDRAAARREAYGQPDAPNADKHDAKKARYEPAPAPVQPPAQPDKDGIQATNVGSKMLAKMGWQKGEGLGNGNGRVDPISAAQYTKGVGLGASTGTTVGMYDDTKKGFMEQVKDKTVQRFNQD